MDIHYRAIYLLAWIVGIAIFAGIVWAVRHWDIFPHKRLRNIPFGAIKKGQAFLDYGGDDMRLRKYIKVSELEAKCISVTGNPLVEFDPKDNVKIEVFI
jgi:hypothetical protein